MHGKVRLCAICHVILLPCRIEQLLYLVGDITWPLVDCRFMSKKIFIVRNRDSIKCKLFSKWEMPNKYFWINIHQKTIFKTRSAKNHFQKYKWENISTSTRAPKKIQNVKRQKCYFQCKKCQKTFSNKEAPKTIFKARSA